MPVGIPKKKPVSLIKAQSYFEHNSKDVHLDIIEWPEPIEVKESTSETAIQRVREEWLNSIKESNRE